MPLIDEIGNEEKKIENNEIICGSCKSKLNAGLYAKICQNCFNKSVENALNEIKQSIKEIKNKLKEIEIAKKQAIEQMNSENTHIIYKNKAEIDLLNLECIYEKLLIDLKTNVKGFELNQKQANDFRKLNNWEVKEIEIIEEGK